MPNYISSNANRVYIVPERAYGQPAPAVNANRLPASRVQCHQWSRTTRRRDKTGSRTHLADSQAATRLSSFALNAQLTSWEGASGPPLGPLVRAAMGEAAPSAAGMIVSAVNGSQLQSQGPHSLSIGSALSNGSELRFVVSIANSSTVDLNLPFASAPAVGSTLAPVSVYKPAAQLPSVSIYDYWDPENGVSRLVVGAGVDSMEIDVKGDVHELRFVGRGADIVDSCSGIFGSSGIVTFPTEPQVSQPDYKVVGGQLGEVWLGRPLNRVFTLTEASVEVRNNLRLREREYGSAYASGHVPGNREVTVSFTLLAQADANMRDLYAAAKARVAVSAMLQLGARQGQMMSVYLPGAVPEMPLFNDSEPYLLWEFKNAAARGVAEDEAYIAFA